MTAKTIHRANGLSFKEAKRLFEGKRVKITHSLIRRVIRTITVHKVETNPKSDRAVLTLVTKGNRRHRCFANTEIEVLEEAETYRAGSLTLAKAKQLLVGKRVEIVHPLWECVTRKGKVEEVLKPQCVNAYLTIRFARSKNLENCCRGTEIEIL